MYDAKAFGPFAFLAYEKSGMGGSIPPISPACFPRARRNMGKAREATPEKPRFPRMPGTAECAHPVRLGADFLMPDG